MKVPPFNSIRQTSSLPTQTCTWGGSKLFSRVLTTNRNCPSTATVGIEVPGLGDGAAMCSVYRTAIHTMMS